MIARSTRLSPSVHSSRLQYTHSTSTLCLQVCRVSRGGNSDEGTGIHDTIQFTPRVLVALLLACVCALLANAAGIGGGPIYLPLLMVRFLIPLCDLQTQGNGFK